ncbi:MAG TPA: AlpA family phage regulatory protein [Hyphomicrobium sp.]|nr:AlpA family phage regulatory protein [Hyphomicrobium sp.]
MTATSSETRILSPKAVAVRTSLSRTTLWRLVRQGEFPAPLKLSANRIGYPEEAINRWLKSRMSQAEAI